MDAQAVGLKVTDVVVLIDREQGAEARLAGNGLKLHSAFPLSFILQVLRWLCAGLLCRLCCPDAVMCMGSKVVVFKQSLSFAACIAAGVHCLFKYPANLR